MRLLRRPSVMGVPGCASSLVGYSRPLGFGQVVSRSKCKVESCIGRNGTPVPRALVSCRWSRRVIGAVNGVVCGVSAMD